MQTNDRNAVLPLSDNLTLAAVLLGCFVWTLSSPLSGAHAGKDEPGEWVVLFDGESNFAKMPDFAKAKRGHIALQHASVSPLKARVWYRNVRLRELP